MSHFRVEANVPKGKLEAFMRATVGPWEINVKEYVENGEDPSPKTTARGKQKANGKRGKPDSMLTMSGKRPQDANGLLAKGLQVFETMEAEHGIGAISVKVFRAQMTSNGLEGHKLQTRLLHEGYLDYLG